MFRLSRSSQVFIALNSKTLSVYQDDALIKSYPIAIGKSSTPSPIGQWQVINKKILDGSTVFGTRWIGLSAASYGIHGTNNPNSIGTAASLGCIRMYNQHVEELFPMVALGTSVVIAQKDLSQPTAFNPTMNSPGHTHTVKAGDTLWQIANQYHIPMEQLITYNPNLNPYQLHIGQVIHLP